MSHEKPSHPHSPHLGDVDFNVSNTDAFNIAPSGGALKLTIPTFFSTYSLCKPSDISKVSAGTEGNNVDQQQISCPSTPPNSPIQSHKNDFQQLPIGSSKTGPTRERYDHKRQSSTQTSGTEVSASDKGDATDATDVTDVADQFLREVAEASLEEFRDIEDTMREI